MKHIAVVIPDFPIPSETFVVTEIKALLKAGHEVTIFCFNLRYQFIELPNQVEVVEINTALPIDMSCLLVFNPFHLIKSFICAYRQREISTMSLLFYGAKLAALAKKRGCQHFHCHFLHSGLAYALVAAKLTRLTVSGVGHGNDINVESKDLQYKLQMCDFCIAVCRDMNMTFSTLGVKKSYLIECGVDVEHFSVNPIGVHLIKQDRRLKLLFFGRLIDKKGLEYALEAIAKIDVAHRPYLDIVGKGPKYQHIQNQIKRLKLDGYVSLLGQHTPNWIIKSSVQYDAFIAPFNTTDNGEFNTSLLSLKEAMAMGLPVITCDDKGCKDVVSCDVGYVVKPKDSEALREAIESFNYIKPSVRKKMGELARKRVGLLFDSFSQAKKLSLLIEQTNK